MANTLLSNIRISNTPISNTLISNIRMENIKNHTQHLLIWFVLSCSLLTNAYADDIEIFYIENVPAACESKLTSEPSINYQYFKDTQTIIFKDTVSFSNSPMSISTSNQFTHNDNLYYALFSPNEYTVWQGNLKRYKLSSSGEIIDKNNNAATNSITGLFLETAQSYWNDTIDGSQVTKGGITERLNVAARNIYVNHQSSLVKLNTIDNPTLTNDDFALKQTDLTQPSVKQDHINWMINQTSITDPLHSSPMEISYQDLGSVIFFGDNQGYIHAIDAESGNELWAFMPKELLKNQAAIRTPSLAFPLQTLPSDKSNHIYGMDGKIVTWTENGRKYIVNGMRRGGSSYYALDVTNRLTPTLQWKISSEQSDFSNLGQTWSTPVKTSIKVNGKIKSVLIFGGGYDPQQDTVTTRTKDRYGDSLYIVDAMTGSVIFKKDKLGYSIPSDIKAIDIDGDNVTDQIYVGDMGGRVLRFDINDNGLEHHIVADIANSGQINNRRFYHAPDLSFLTNTTGLTLAIAIGSGYHAHPNNTQTSDKFYLFKVSTTLVSAITTIKESDLLAATINTNDNLLANKSGWYLSLSNNEINGNNYGEKVLSSSLTLDNVVWFTTFEPSVVTNQCIVRRGISKLYRVNINNGTPNYKKAIPEIIDGQVDSTKSCDNTICNEQDRYIELNSASIPPSPNLIHIGNEQDNGSVICIGTYCTEQAKRKSYISFWRQL